MRISILAPGDIEYHFQELLKIPKEKFENEINNIAKTLADWS